METRIKTITPQRKIWEYVNKDRKKIIKKYKHYFKKIEIKGNKREKYAPKNKNYTKKVSRQTINKLRKINTETDQIVNETIMIET